MKDNLTSGKVNHSYLSEEKKASSNSTAAAKKATTQEEKPPSTASEAFDRILNAVGGYGRWQWKMCFITGFCGLFTSLHNLGAVFLAAYPDHWCKIPSLNLNDSYSKELRNYTIPWVINKDGVLAFSKCEYYDADYSNDSHFNYNVQEIQSLFDGNSSPPIKKCNSWHYDTSIYESTLVSEWDFVCNRRWLMSVTQASYMFGILMGAVVASAASDKIGRRKATLMCVVVFFLSSVSAAFSTSYEMFFILRFFTAAAGQGMYLVNFVLLMEVVGLEGRSILPSLYGIFFVTGSCLLPAIAYLLREWRQLQLTNGSLTFVLFLYFWLFPESPRWLVMQGRFDEGLKILEEIAQTNGGQMPDKQKLELYTRVISNEAYNTKNCKSAWEKTKQLYDDLVTLVRTPNMRRRNLVIFYAWFVISSSFYGLSFSGYNLNISIYLLIFLVSLAGFPLVPFVIYLLNRHGRRFAIVLSMAVCGLACLAVFFIPNRFIWLNLILLVIGRAMTGSAFLCAFIFSSELVPTNIRNLSMGIASMWGRIGSMISPFIVDLLGEIYYSIPSTIFGVMALITAGLCMLLPEPGFSPLPESIEEIESLPR